jgi:hypothetical protein
MDRGLSLEREISMSTSEKLKGCSIRGATPLLVSRSSSTPAKREEKKRERKEKQRLQIDDEETVSPLPVI